MKLQRDVLAAETALEQKRLARHNLLLACKIQGLPINLQSGSLDEISEVQVKTYSRDLQSVLCFSSVQSWRSVN